MKTQYATKAQIDRAILAACNEVTRAVGKQKVPRWFRESMRPKVLAALAVFGIVPRTRGTIEVKACATRKQAKQAGSLHVRSERDWFDSANPNWESGGNSTDKPKLKRLKLSKQKTSRHVHPDNKGMGRP